MRCNKNKKSIQPPRDLLANRTACGRLSGTESGLEKMPFETFSKINPLRLGVFVANFFVLRKYSNTFVRKALLTQLLLCHPLFSITQNYDMEINTGEGSGNQSMVVSTKKDHVEVVVIDHKKEKQVVQFKNKTEFQKSEYVNGEGKKFLEVKYDYANKKISVTGNVNNEFALKGDVYDNNGSLFYLFSQIFPQKNETMKFTLLQSKLDLTVGMYLKQVGEEELIIGGKKINALKYEMGLSSKIAAAFWPHKYYYWYDATDRRFLKYEGLGENKKVQTIQIVKYREK